MQIVMTLFTAALFFALTPGILLTLPTGGSKIVVAMTHALVFALVYHLIHKAFYVMIYGEGFEAPFNPMFFNCGAASSPNGPKGENPPRANCQY